jgi:SAM-dependent methyltransferase
MIHKLKQIYTKEKFSPSLLGVFINPYYFCRRGLYKGIDSNKRFMKGRLLDLGCGEKPYKEVFDVREYIGLDIEESGHSHKNEQIDVYYDGKTIPFGNNYFDSIFSSEVFEHIFNLEQILNELHRVIKPGGHMLITLPFVWDEHEIPYDFARYTSFGIEHLLKKNGFEIITIEKTTNYVETVFQIWNVYVNQFVLPSNNFLKVLMTPLFIAPVTIFGIFVSKILPKNKNCYLNNIVVAKKPTSST